LTLTRQHTDGRIHVGTGHTDDIFAGY